MKRLIHRRKINITLIELLIAVSIIGIVAAIVIPILAGDYSFLETASDLACEEWVEDTQCSFKSVRQCGQLIERECYQ